MEGVMCSDEPTEYYHQQYSFPQLWSVLAGSISLFWFHGMQPYFFLVRSHCSDKPGFQQQQTGVFNDKPTVHYCTSSTPMSRHTKLETSC